LPAKFHYIVAVLTIALLASISLQVPAPPVVRGPTARVPEIFFGLHIHHAADLTPWPRSPVFAWRLWDSDVAWSHLQPKPDQWNFTLLDKYVELAQAHHTELLLTLGHTPRWAAARPDEESASKVQGAASEPKDIAVWREYVRRVATRYKGKIRTYEIWNEPNLTGYFSGTVAQMVKLAEDAYTILKEVDSSNLVVSPAAMGGGSNLRWLDDFLSQGGGKYCDIVGYHFYVTPNAPEDMVSLIEQVKVILSRHNIYKPLWNTESGWSMGKQFADDDERMGYLVRSFVLAWVSGVERFYWYAYDNYNWVSLPLTLPDRRTLTPAGKAYATLQSWLIGSRIKTCSRAIDGSWSCELIRPNGLSARILWASNNNRAMLTRVSGYDQSEIRYLDGRTESKDISAGLRLTSAPILLDHKATY
jgi:hypothetical protein